MAVVSVSWLVVQLVMPVEMWVSSSREMIGSIMIAAAPPFCSSRYSEPSVHIIMDRSVMSGIRVPCSCRCMASSFVMRWYWVRSRASSVSCGRVSLVCIEFWYSGLVVAVVIVDRIMEEPIMGLYYLG